MSTSLALVPQQLPDDGMFSIPGVTFTPTGMIIESSLPIGHWIAAGLALRRAGDAFQLCVGDWVRFGKRKYKHGEMYKKALAVTGYTEGSLKNNVWVANKVPPELRPEGHQNGDFLKFSHYKIVAPLRTDKLKKKWLGLAIRGDGKKPWSASRLRHEIEKASKPRKQEAFTVELQRLHDTVVRQDLDGAIADLRKRIEISPDPLLATTYRRAIEMFEWQKNRTLENDVAAIVKIFSAEEGTEAPERVSDDYISVWMREHGFIMGETELLDRLKLMLRLKMFTVEDRTESKGEKQSGTVTSVYAPEMDFALKLGSLDELPSLAQRTAALRKDWAERIARYAPEMVEKDKAA